VDFSITQAQDELSALCRQILGDHVTPARLAELEQGGSGFDPELWADLAEAGVLSATLPASAGGDDYGLAEQCSILAEVGRAVAPVPFLESVVLAAGAIARFGTADQAQRWAIPVATGSLVATAALVESGDEDPLSPGTKATSAGEGWRLDGTKTTVPAGTSAGLFLVPARTDHGTAVFCVEPDDPGVSVEPQQVVFGPGAAQLALDGTTLGADRLLGGPGGDAGRGDGRHGADGGPEVAGWLASRATIGLCALQLGVTERALELTAEHARTRQQFGRPIGAFQAVAQRLADAYIDVEAIRLTMWQAAWRLESGLPSDEEIATAKFWAADAGHRVAHSAVHIHGGVGIDTSHMVHRYFATAKRNEFALGGATAQLRRLGAALATS
jgi:3-oxocholest-4-en-26-oyl-CoA dehydrogenase beta subunit